MLCLIGLAAGLTATSYAQSELAGKTTVQQRVYGGNNLSAFSFLDLKPGEPHLVREDGIAGAIPARARRRRSLLYFAQLSDFQLADEESPARVEFVDITANKGGSDVFNAAQRPHEAFVAHAAEASIRQVNRFLTSPVAAAGGRRAQMAFSIFTGDLADSQQLNETRGVLGLLEGGTVNPNSGVGNEGCPPGTPGADEAARYTGVQDRDDVVEGPQFYDPDQPDGMYATWPRYPGLMDRAQVPISATGLRVPSYVVFGNHDGLAQGNASATRAYEDVGTGCYKPTAPAFDLMNPQSALDPSYLSGLATSNPGRVSLVPRDPDRRYVDHKQFKEIFKAGQADAHGFGFVDPTENAAGNGHTGYYAWSPKPGFRFVAVDTVSEGGVPGVSALGNLDDPQFRWLERQLAAAQRADELTIVFGHHPLRRMTSPLPDEAAGPCTGDDGHGHGHNPGCDRDPRDSQPIHQRADLEALFKKYPHVVATVFGHSHENKITSFPLSRGGGFWEITSASHIDWPIQSRLIEVMDNRDGTLSVFGTVLDVDAPVRAPVSNTPAGGFGVPEIASIARTIAYNDLQQGGNPTGNGAGPITTEGGDGERRDRNVELVVRDPRRSTGGSGRCATPRGRVRGKFVGVTSLGRSRSRNRRRFPASSRGRFRRSMDRFCLVGDRFLRIGYPSRPYRRKMSRRDRRRTRGRAVLALTDHPRHALKRVRNGSSVRTLRRRFRGERRYRVGKNTWYLAQGKAARIVFKTRRRRVIEVGLADKRLTSTRAESRRFLRAFSR